MTAQEIQHNIAQVKELAWGLVSTAALCVAVDLELADHLDDGPRSRDELASATGADPVALGQLLDALAARGVLHRTAAGGYANTGLSLLLRKNDPNSMTDLVRWIGHPVFWRLWPHLDDAVREGKPRSVEVFGKDFFRYLHEEEPEAVATFTGAMTQASNHTATAIADSLDLSGTSMVADIGGGQGRLLAAILEKAPDVRGVLLDLPGVVAQALPGLREGTLADRVTLVGGDCRQAVPVTADLYVLKNILDWDDASTVRTLENVRRAAPPGARVVVVETLSDHTPEPEVTTSLDLLLLLNVGGHQHTARQVADLFARGGIRFDGVRPTGTFLQLVEGTVAAGEEGANDVSAS
nr:TamO [uncultured bacterium]